jgi:hypothetical protein
MIKAIASATGFVHNIYERFINSYKTPVGISLGLHHVG